jgi:hypothetical protein
LADGTRKPSYQLDLTNDNTTRAPDGMRVQRWTRIGGSPNSALRSRMRRSTDKLYVRRLGPRDAEALRIVGDRPGITVAELRDELRSAARACGKS